MASYGTPPQDGSIPAWAGQPIPVAYNTRPGEVYPRVGGATPPFAPADDPARGLSPRGRGNRGHLQPRYYVVGSIPAWAGQPLAMVVCNPPKPVYPRVGGATTLRSCMTLSLNGLSPRGRGNQLRVGAVGVIFRSIPAWAGQPPLASVRWKQSTVYPRVGGATVGGGRSGGCTLGLSPRGRGNHRVRCH